MPESTRGLFPLNFPQEYCMYFPLPGCVACGTHLTIFDVFALIPFGESCKLGDVLFFSFLDVSMILLSVWVYHALMLHTGMYCLPRVERLDWALYSMWLDFMNPWPYFILCHCYTACNWNKWKIKLLNSNIKPNWYLIITCNFQVSTKLHHFHSAGPSVLILL